MTPRDVLTGFRQAGRAPAAGRSDGGGRKIGAYGLAPIFAVIAAWLLAAAPDPASAQSTEAQRQPTLVFPLVSVERGRQLFVNKGCVICHSINGVGGQAAAALDAAPGQRSINILDFVSRMFMGASAMLDLQATELGYQIALQPQEIGDLAAFVYDSETQAGFSYAEVPVPLQDWILNEPYWEFEEWPDDLPEIYPELEDGSKR